MREIKFRGKAKLDGKWWFGNLVPKDTRGRTQINNPEHGGCFDIDPNTIGQFTGLKDSIGKEIYEGDIIRSFDSKGEPIIHYIQYDDEEAGFVAVLKGSAKGDFGYGRCYQQWITNCEKEVIGNIHDNPELLK